ncbi:hypothetical protein ALC60_05677 [Trachymyrmex zeteki]|uniref:Uncharacterized protein n=1 Tax=Mycetomoellerius zeteki TaxID=64791 RepID=A0A151X5A3_9HYME|nr:hypothetical protein ALC60_05677 [Trachymyrmex zeteki]
MLHCFREASRQFRNLMKQPTRHGRSTRLAWCGAAWRAAASNGGVPTATGQPNRRPARSLAPA